MRKALPVAAPSLLVFVLLGGNAVAQPARDWLERMSRAVDELNYTGTFVHVLDGTPETLHIVHRHADGQSGERILSLDGARRAVFLRPRQDRALARWPARSTSNGD